MTHSISTPCEGFARKFVGEKIMSVSTSITPPDQSQESPELGRKAAGIRDAYRRVLREPGLTDREIDDMRAHIVRLARTLCEHVWGKRFY